MPCSTRWQRIFRLRGNGSGTIRMHQHTINTPYIVGEVHCYSATLDGELALFDCGPPTDEAFAALQSRIDLSRLKYLFLTHCHIDHYGLAARIAKTSGARVLIPRADVVKFRHRDLYRSQLAALLAEIGLDTDIIHQIREKLEREHRMISLPADFEIVEESDLPARLGIRCISCPGHSQSDMVYACDDDAVTGDILLRNISQVPVLALDLGTLSGRFRNYDAYCTSLLSLGNLRGLRILPGHRWHVESIDATIKFYVGKLLERAELVGKYLGSEPVIGIARILYGDVLRNPFFAHMKISELIFTVDFLEDPGRLRTQLEALGLFDDLAESYYRVVNGDTSDNRLIHQAI